MTTLYAALNNALSGLDVNRQALATLSQNISNANTPGYSRQVVNLADNIVGGQGNGVKVADISRQVDSFLQAASQQQNSVFSKYSVLNDYGQRIQSLLGTPSGDATATSDTSIASSITGFFNSLQQLEQSPADGSLQLAAVQSGNNLALSVSNLAKGLEGLRFQADQQINQDVNAVNQTLLQLKSTNAALAQASSSGANVSDLLDQRDKQISALSQYLDISYYYDSNNEAHVASGGTTLLDSEVYQLSYSPQSSADNFSNNIPSAAITVAQANSAGQIVGKPVTLVSDTVNGAAVTGMMNGEIRGLLDLRDTQLPQMLNQLDTLAASLRDQMNAINNSGSPYPGANSYTGQRQVVAGDTTNWSGSVQIALLNQTGQPVQSPYQGDTSGLPPLNLDLSTLNSGNGAGNPSTQAIINAINSYYAPQNRVSLGDINNIQMASDSTSLAGTPPKFSFDFNLQNLSAGSANLFVTGVTVTDANNATIATSATSTAPSISLASTGTFTTTANSSLVTVKTSTSTAGLKNGDYVYLSAPSGAVDGLQPDQLSGFFQVSNVTANGFDINAEGQAVGGGSFDSSGITALPKYTTIDAGDNARTNSDGVYTVSLGGNPTSSYYTISVNVTTQNADGTLSNGTVQYQIQNTAPANGINTLYGASAASGDAKLTAPTSYTPLVTATLVDANGNALPTTKGQYTAGQNGFLKITATNPNNVLAIDSQDSKQLGLPNTVPPVAGTNTGFSQYFALNNFFNVNTLTSTGDTVAGSALKLSVQSRILANPGLLSSGQLQQSAPNADGTPNYTYTRSPGDNSILQKMVTLGTTNINFVATGGLSTVSTSLNGYAGQIITFASTTANNAKSNYNDAQTVHDSLEQQMSSTSGVNLDQELANTIIYQNAYSASARIVTVTNSLFTTLLSSFQS